jgi:hypothetical protein
LSDFNTQFQAINDFLGNTTKGIFNKIDQFTFKMLVDNLKSNDPDSVMEAIEQLVKEKRPLGVPPLYFVSRAHPSDVVRGRAAKAIERMGYTKEVEEATKGKEDNVQEATKALIIKFGNYKQKK